MGFCLQSDKIHFIVHISCTTEMHIGYGIVDEIEGVSDFDRIVCEMENILKMLKYHFYKEEYLL